MDFFQKEYSDFSLATYNLNILDIIWKKINMFTVIFFFCRSLKKLRRQWFLSKGNFPAGNYIFKVNNRNFRTRFEICSKLTIKC